VRWTCPRCNDELTREDANQVADSDGRSADATVTKWSCARCGVNYSHWLMPRAARVDGKIVDASRETWMPSAPNLVFEEPWSAVDDSAKLDAELAREIPRDHPLFGKKVRAIARSGACDDVLFAGDEEVYVVHLTWRQETDPRWPTTTRYRSLAQFAEQCMDAER
jgi:hypothetical protein